MSYRCIHCGFPVETLFIQYFPGNIRLMKCEICRSIADEYIECEIMILLIDLVLHKMKAYRHLLYNLPSLHGACLERLGTDHKILQIFRDYGGNLLFAIFCWMQIVLYRSNNEWVPSRCLLESLSIFGKLLSGSFLGTLASLCVVHLALKYLWKSFSKTTRFTEVLLATLVSSYFKITLIAMMVWQFPVSAIFIIDVFILSSNAVALKVPATVIPDFQPLFTRCKGNRNILHYISKSEMITFQSVAVCFVAHSAKLLVNHAALLAS